MKERAYNYLNRDRLYYIDMLETLDRGLGELLYADDNGVMMLNTAGKDILICADSREALERMCHGLARPALITVHQVELVPLLQEKFGYKCKMECCQCAYLSKDRLDTKLSEVIELRELTMEELRFVVENYEHHSDERYIAERIQAGMIGAFCENKLAGFIGFHSEGAMGMLQVIPDYRRRGIAYSLEAALINRMLDEGYIPYAHIVTTNKASLLLQEKIGMSFSEKTVTWLYDE